MASQLVVDEESKEGPLNRSSVEYQEAPASAEESTAGEDQVTPKKRGRKRTMVEGEVRGEEVKKKRAGSMDRPSRERKSVERYAALPPIRGSVKTLAIQQGSGEKLKDIPNVAFKLSKRKGDESLRVLHRILFGRHGNVYFLKRNILQFSGFVWSQNEEKDRLKVKQKLNKYNKDRLLDLSDLLDIYTSKVNTKKEDVSAKLVEFLESPHVTRDVIISEKIKRGRKRKQGVKRTGERALDEASGEKEKKSQGEKKQRREPTNDDKEDADSIDRDDESVDEDESADLEETCENSKGEEEDGEKSSDEEGIDEHEEELESKHHSPAARKAPRGISKKCSPSSKKKADKEGKSKVTLKSKSAISKDTKRSSNMRKTSKKGQPSSKKKVDTESKAGILKDTKQSSTEKVDTEDLESKAEPSKDTKGSSKMKKDKEQMKNDSKDNSKRKVSAKDDISKKANKRKEKSNGGTASKGMTGSNKEGAKLESNNAEKQGKKKELSVVPNTEQLSAAVSEILKEVDFSVATLADIIRQLGARFDADLMNRKAEIKRILEEVINTMTDDEDAEDAEAEIN